MHGACTAALALLFAGAAAGAGTPLVCSAGPAEVCVTVEAALEASIRACVEGGSAAGASGGIALSGGLAGKTPFVTSPSTEGTMSCAGGVATLQLSATASVVQLADNLPMGGTLLTVELTVAQAQGSLSVEWSGTLVGGKIGSPSSGLEVGFTVGKASAGASVGTTLYVDIEDLSEVLGVDVDLDLPSRLTYTEAGLPFFDESIVGSAASCPFNTLSVLPELSIPGVSAALQVSTATVDVCAFVAGDGAAPFVRVAAGTVAPVSVNGLVLGGLSVEVTAAYAGAAVEWSGSLSASATVFGTVASDVSAQFSATALEALEVQVAVAKPAFSVSGTVSYASGGCTSANAGTVTVSVPSAGLSAAGTIAQKDGCGADGTTGEWTIMVVSADALEVAWR